MDALLTYCSRFREGFSGAIQPASAEDMTQLEALAGQPFPPEYRAWLTRMGRTPHQALGAFLDDLAFGVDAITAFYTDPPAPVPSDAIYLWTANEDAEMFLSTGTVDQQRAVLHFSWPVDPATGRFLDQQREDFLVATSLLAFLYREAFTKLRLPALSHRVGLRENIRAPKPNVEHTNRVRLQMGEIAQRMGFVSLPHLGVADVACLDRKDAAVWFSSERRAADILTLKADDERELQRLAEIFADNLDFSVWP